MCGVRISKSVSLIGVSIVLSAPIAAHSDEEAWTFGDLQSAVTQVQLFGNTDLIERSILTEITRSIGTLRNQYLARYGEGADVGSALARNVSVQYGQSMAADLSSLQTLPNDHSLRLTELKDIRDDLALKVRFVSKSLGKSLGFAATFPSVIHVTIDTIDSSGRNISGLWVRCNPGRYGLKRPAIYVFNSASTPTDSMLPPGRFLLWAEDSSGHVLASHPIDMGSDGLSVVRMNFVVR